MIPLWCDTTRIWYCYDMISLGYDTTRIWYHFIDTKYQCYINLLPPLQDERATSTALKWHIVWGREKLGSDIWVNQWESVVICSVSSSLPTSPTTFLCTAHFYTLDILVKKEIHSLCELKCYLVAKIIPTQSKPALWWRYGNIKKFDDIIELTCFHFALNYTY
jgi:hypothetical protein